MKLSQIKGTRCLEVIADVVEPIARIAEDKEAKAIFAPKKKPKNMTAAAFMAQRVRKGLPSLLRNHEDDIVEILATINGVTPEEYAREMTMASLITDVMDVLLDSDFVSFFTSAAATGGSPTSASGTTEDREDSEASSATS